MEKCHGNCDKCNLPPSHCVDMYDDFYNIADKPIPEPGILTTNNNESTYVPGVSPDKCKNTITGGEPNVTYTIKEYTERLDNQREYIAIKKEGHYINHTKPKNRRNKVKRKHKH